MSWLRIFGLGRRGGGNGGAKGDDALAVLAPWRDAQRRTAFRPRTEDRDGPLDASKFCGVPWLARDERWPACASCGSPMPLFLQLDLAAASRETGKALGTGLLQLFYCVQDGCDAEGWAPFQGGKLVRVVEGGAAGVAQPPPAIEPPLPPKVITGWEPVDDFPGGEEHDELGLVYEYDFTAKRLTVRWPERSVAVQTGDLDLAEKLADAAPGDKLLGWPHWIQGVEYPECPRCGRRMELLVQVDSEDHVPYMFGDVGCGHVTRCPDHPDVVAFGWACS
jgi:hypothetical protein